VHTSAKAHFTSVAIRIPIRIQIRDPDRHQNLTICSLVHCQPSLKISCKSVRKFFCAKLLTDRQTDRQTNSDDYISSLPEVIGLSYFTGQRSPISCTHKAICVTAAID